ncbi:MAG: RNA chaperone Hfq [Proteobacteria bacterium]|jgi:host factor-I protein|nr:RNA chaperone Hfq [Pseudomonadota bacterium]
MSHEKSVNVQDAFLNHIRKNKTPLTVFLVNGVKLQGNITWFDTNTILLRREGHAQLIYKHAISTLMPHGPVSILDYQNNDREDRYAQNNAETAVVSPSVHEEDYDEED